MMQIFFTESIANFLNLSSLYVTSLNETKFALFKLVKSSEVIEVFQLVSSILTSILPSPALTLPSNGSTEAVLLTTNHA